MNRIVFCIASFVLGLTACVHAQFTLTDQVICPEFVGFGANICPFVYCAPNTTEVTARNIKDFEKKVIDLKLQHVRIFVRPSWWEETAEKDKAYSVEKILRLIQQSGGTVNITLWGGVRYPHMGSRMAALMAHLINEEHFDCIRYVTLQNEPNLNGVDMDLYIAGYRQFDAEMRKLGLRDRVKIIGGDLVSTDQEFWFSRLTKDLPDILDGWSVHMYSDYWNPEHLLQRVSEVPAIVDKLPEAGRKPVYLMEFGVRGHRLGHEEPGKYIDGTPFYDTPLASAMLGWNIVEAINRGYVATCQWDLVDVMYDRNHMYYGLIGEPLKGWQLKPEYHLLNLLIHTGGMGWQSIRVDGDAEADHLAAAAMRSVRGAVTLYVVNWGDKEQHPSLGGVHPDQAFHCHLWNKDGRGIVTDEADVMSDHAGAISTTLPPRSFVALTRDNN